MIDDDTHKRLLGINEGFYHVCKILDEKRDNEILPRLIPLVDELTHILLDESKNRLQ
jgi:hypothetical protein